MAATGSFEISWYSAEVAHVVADPVVNGELGYRGDGHWVTVQIEPRLAKIRGV